MLLKAVLILAAAAAVVTPLPRVAVESVYARGVDPLVQPRLTALSNTTPFAWLDVAGLIVAGSIVAMWAVRLRRRSSGALVAVGGLSFDTAAIAAVVYLWFLAAWGLNYQREPLRTRLDFREDRITREALLAFARQGVDSLNTLHASAHAAGWPELRDVPDTLGPAFRRAQEDLALTWRVEPGVPKRSLLNFYFTRVSVDGMTDPFFLGTLANQSLLPFERDGTVAHEWGHLAGFADESEAGFFGWLVCMRGSAPAQYSGWLSVHGTVLGALPQSDRDEISRGLGQGPRADLEAIRERIRRQSVPMASRAGYALYDRFLKANRVESGIRSYSEVIRLLLGTTFTDEGAPVLR